MSHFLLIVPTESADLPAGYQTPDAVMDYVVDCRDHGAVHPIKYGLETKMQLHDAWIAGVGFPASSNVGFILPAGTFGGFGLNTNVALNFTDQNNTAFADPTWNECRWHFIAPYAPLGVTKQTIFEASVYESSNTITMEPDDDWASKATWHSCEIRSAGVQCLRHGGRDLSPGGGLPAALHSPMGTRIEFFQCKFGDHSLAPGLDANSRQPRTAKWGVQTFWTAPWFKDCEFSFANCEEHAVYAHNESTLESGFDNCTFAGIGGQLWQGVCRDWTTTGSSAWTSDTYEGEWPGRGTTTIKNIVCDEGFNRNVIRASNPFKCWGTGRDWVIDNVHVRRVLSASQITPSPTDLPGGNDFSSHPEGMLAFNTNSYIGPGTYAWKSWREHNHFPTHQGAFGKSNGILTLSNSTFVLAHPDASGSKEMNVFASFETVTVDSCGFYFDSADPGGGDHHRVCEENVDTGGNDTYGIGEADIDAFTWTNNNTAGTLTEALTHFPDMTSGQQTSDPQLVEGTQNGLDAGYNRGASSTDFTVSAWYEYPGSVRGTEDAGNDPWPGGHSTT